MVINASILLNELELLKLRLHEMYRVVDRFYVLESRVTFAGRPKRLSYQEHADEFEQWRDKIVYIEVPPCPNLPEDAQAASWARQNYQRDYLKEVLPRLKEFDVFSICDADEIISAQTILNYRPRDGAVGLELAFFHFYLNYGCVNKVWKAPYLVPGSLYNQYPVHRLRPFEHFSYKSDPYPLAKRLERAGWHFSYLLGPEGPVRVQYKLKNYSHCFGRHTLPILYALQGDVPVDMRRLGRQVDPKGGFIFDRMPDAPLPRWVTDNRAVYESKGYLL